MTGIALLAGLLQGALVDAAAPLPGMVDVAAEFGLKPDGLTDATAGLQKAFDKYTGSGRIMYLRPGVYIVSDTVRAAKGENRWGHTHLWGAGPGRTIIRLKDGAFASAASPKPILTWERHGSADWFHNSAQDFSIEAGRGNPGAVGIEFYSNNTGVMRRVHVSGSKDARIGIDLGHGDMNGPLLVESCRVEGFETGLKTAFGVNSQTISGLELKGQGKVGLHNGGQCLSIENLRVTDTPQPVRNEGGWSHMTLVNSTLAGSGDAAIVSDGYLALDGVASPGFAWTAKQMGKGVGSGKSGLWGSHAEAVGPGLAIEPKRPPALPQRLRGRALAGDFGARPNDDTDDTEAIQRALDSGAEDVVLGHGQLMISRTLKVGPKVRRIHGMQCYLVATQALNDSTEPMLHISGEGAPLFLECITTGFMGGSLRFVRHDGARVLVMRDLQVNLQGSLGSTYEGSSQADVFIENVVGNNIRFGRQNVWARQLNVENEGTKIRNLGGRLWILGLKTERGGTLVENSLGGRTVVAGGFCYTTTAGKLAPMFVNKGGSMLLSLGEACFTGDPFGEILAGERTLAAKDLPSRAFGAALTWVASRKQAD